MKTQIEMAKLMNVLQNLPKYLYKNFETFDLLNYLSENNGYNIKFLTKKYKKLKNILEKNEKKSFLRQKKIYYLLGISETLKRYNNMYYGCLEALKLEVAVKDLTNDLNKVKK